MSGLSSLFSDSARKAAEHSKEKAVEFEAHAARRDLESHGMNPDGCKVGECVRCHSNCAFAEGHKRPAATRSFI